MKKQNQLLSYKNQKGVHPPLFDCLTLEYPSKILLDLEGLQTSIARELDLILNTRSVNKKFEEGDRGQIQFFGLRDFALQQVTHPSGQRQMILEITQVIEAYEPRLKNVQIQLSGFEKDKRSVTLKISGDIQYGDIKANTTFPIFVKDLFSDKSDNLTKI